MNKCKAYKCCNYTSHRTGLCLPHRFSYDVPVKGFFYSLTEEQRKRILNK